MDIARYYTSQSFITDPGEYAYLYENLPHDIDGLCRVVQGLVIHYRGGEMFDYIIPEGRKTEIDTRYVPEMLARIQELDNRPLTEERPPERRFVGCCRDFATLFCSMARYRGIPTRTRIGFASYFDAAFNHDHEIAECWDADAQCWRLVDPEMSPQHIRENRITFDVQDVPRDQFMVGGLVWQQCRSGQADPNLFGVDPNTNLKGMSFIPDYVVLDVAALNKWELLLWDAWGLMLKGELSEDDIALLDRLAILTQGGNETLVEAQSIYEHDERVHVPTVIMKFGPVSAPCEVRLQQ
ncbi:MAG: transglutaminase-like domain-containing protein [Ktedonobacteraceae bacterium]